MQNRRNTTIPFVFNEKIFLFFVVLFFGIGLNSTTSATSLNQTTITPHLFPTEENEKVFQQEYLDLLEELGPDDPACLTAADLLLEHKITIGRKIDTETFQLALDTLYRRLRILDYHHPEVATSLGRLANLHFFSQEYTQAKILHARSVKIFRQKISWYDPRLGHALLDEGESHRELREYQEAELLIDESYQHFVEIFGPNSLEVAKALGMKSLLYRNTGRPEQALAASRKSLEIQQQHLPENHVHIASTFCQLGHIYNSLMRYDEGFQALDHALRIWESQYPPGHALLSFPLAVTAHYLMLKGELQEAENRFLQALSIRRKIFGDQSQPYSTILMRTGNFYGWMGEFEKAMECQLKVSQIRHRLQPAGSHSESNALLSLANSKFELGDYSGARSDLIRTLDLQSKEARPNQAWRVRMLRDLGKAELALGNTDAARVQIDQAWTLGNSVGMSTSEHEALLLITGDLLEKERNINQAKETFLKTKLLSENHRTFGVSNEAKALERLAQLAQKYGSTTEAKQYLETALEILTARLSPNHPRIASVSLNLARVQMLDGNTETALDLALDSERFSRSHFRRIARTMSEASALRYARIRPVGLPLALDIVEQSQTPEDISRLWTEVAASRALVLDEITRRRKHGQTASSETADYQHALQVYSNLLVRGPSKANPEQYPEEINRAKNKVETLEKTLAMLIQEPLVRVVEDSLNPERFKKSLPPQGALVSFIKRPADLAAGIPASYYLFVQNGTEQAMHLQKVGDAERIDGLIRQMRRSISLPAMDREVEYRKAGQKLCSLIWNPISKFCSPDEIVYVVPDGALNLVDFGTLPIGENQYLLETHQFQYLTSERDLFTENENHQSGLGLLALGGINFEAEINQPTPDSGTLQMASLLNFRSSLQPCSSIQDLLFKPLPASEKEVIQVAGYWDQAQPNIKATILTGSSATEEQFQELAPGKTIIHIATHGFLVGTECLDSQPGFRGVGGLAPELQSPDASRQKDILPMAGLALAGANQRFNNPKQQQDGILVSLEIAALDLSKTELLVLSGCDTGIGEIEDGEGVFGLRRAVSISGAQTLVLSMWPVEDHNTQAWMDKMYQYYLLDKNSINNSVRLASLNALAKRRDKHLDTHPALWGGFIVSGSGRPVN